MVVSKIEFADMIYELMKNCDSKVVVWEVDGKKYEISAKELEQDND